MFKKDGFCQNFSIRVATTNLLLKGLTLTATLTEAIVVVAALLWSTLNLEKLLTVADFQHHQLFFRTRCQKFLISHKFVVRSRCFESKDGFWNSSTTASAAVESHFIDNSCFFAPSSSSPPPWTWFSTFLSIVCFCLSCSSRAVRSRAKQKAKSKPCTSDRFQQWWFRRRRRRRRRWRRRWRTTSKGVRKEEGGDRTRAHFGPVLVTCYFLGTRCRYFRELN